MYEQRLIQKYINDNGKDPVTGDTLELDDLIEIKSSKYTPFDILLECNTLPYDDVKLPPTTQTMRRCRAIRQQGPKDEIAFSKTTYQLEAVDEPSGDDYTTSSDTTCYTLK